MDWKSALPRLYFGRELYECKENLCTVADQSLNYFDFRRSLDRSRRMSRRSCDVVRSCALASAARSRLSFEGSRNVRVVSSDASMLRNS